MRYYIEFNTNEMQPNIRATVVDIHHELIKEMHRGLAINLCDDPLYPLLAEYVRMNPPKKRYP